MQVTELASRHGGPLKLMVEHPGLLCMGSKPDGGGKGLAGLIYTETASSAVTSLTPKHVSAI